MLTITPHASELIRGVLAADGAPKGSVLRISREPEVGLAVSVTGSPQPDDQIVAVEDVEVCLGADRRRDARRQTARGHRGGRPAHLQRQPPGALRLDEGDRST
jgi:hypothetical protein